MDMSEQMNPWADAAEWVAAVAADNLLTKSGVAVTGASFVYLVPVSGHRHEEIKRDGIRVGDLAVGAVGFGAIKLDTLIAHALKTGLFDRKEDPTC
jgi:hypothetical protein